MLIFDEKVLPKYLQQWDEWLPGLVEDKYARVFQTLYCCTKVSKYRDFQYRLLLCKLVTNRILFEWNIKGIPLCTFCEEHIEDIDHLLYDCEVI